MDNTPPSQSEAQQQYLGVSLVYFICHWENPCRIRGWNIPSLLPIYSKIGIFLVGTHPKCDWFWTIMRNRQDWLNEDGCLMGAVGRRRVQCVVILSGPSVVKHIVFLFLLNL